MMQRSISPAFILFLAVLVPGQADGQTDRAYVILQKQNLVALGSVFAVLLLLMIVMAVCVYKPHSPR
ncbi:hypothetical protein D4764_05G0004830 [Takifugu flavidus]|uniref:Uncharacterized protein n=1 Tax=Takifugu flavidus TaxID=433684 RepID=A0A5C6MZG4_9TELE|nr:hypothetical protein D4764_05G0004830 [Takifugu flavidus]